jgi:uncharacterized protein (TIGR03437 family)
MVRIIFALYVCWIGSAQTYEFRYWNDIPPNPGGAVKPVDYLRRPNTVSARGDGYLVSDELDYRVRFQNAQGVVQSLVGQGSPAVSVPLQPGIQARLSGPREICSDGLGAIWIVDGGRTLRRLNPEGVLDSFGVDANTPANQAPAGLSEAPLRSLSHEIGPLACDSAGFAYFADRRSESIVRVSPLGMARRIAGTGTSAKGSAQRIASDEAALSYGFWGIDSLSWIDGMLFVLDSGRIHRLRLESGLLRSLCTWNDRETSSQKNWPKRLSAEASRVLVLEGYSRVAEVARASWDGPHFAVAGSLPREVFEFSRHEIEIVSIARLVDGSYVAASAMPPNVYRSWGQEWIPVLGSKVREERIPLALLDGYAHYFDWQSADGEALFLARAGLLGQTISGGIVTQSAEGAASVAGASAPKAEADWSPLLTEQYQGEALAGYRQGDDFVSVYNWSNTSNEYRYESGIDWLKDASGAWLKLGTQDGINVRRRAQAARAQEMIPPIVGKVEGIAARARGGLWVTQEGRVLVFDPDTLSITRVAGNGTNRIVEGAAMQSGWKKGLITEDVEGRLLQSTELEWRPSPNQSFYQVIYRLDGDRGTIVRAAGSEDKQNYIANINDGVDVRNFILDNWRFRPCGARGKLLLARPINGFLYMTDEMSLMRKIAGSNLPQPTPTGDPMRSGYGFLGAKCFADGAILMGDGTFQRRARELVPVDYLRVRKVFGDEQSGEIGSTLATEFTVQTVRFGRAEGGRRIRFRILRGEGTLSEADAVSDVQGLARTRLRLANRPGPVWVEAIADTGATVVFRAVARFPVRPIPKIYSGGVGGAALSVPFLRRLAPGGIATLFGENFSERAITLGASDLVGGRVPTMLGDVCVEVGGQRAFLLAVFPGQINFQTPSVPVGREQEVSVVRGCGTATEMRSAGEFVLVGAEAPEFFYESYVADGKSPVIVVRSSDGSVGPARPGEWISLYATGLGATEPSVTPGVVAAGIARVRGAFRLRIGTKDVAAEDVFYAGVAPGTAGQYQINARVPEDLPAGEWPIVMSVGNASSPVGPVIRVSGL